MWCGGGVESYPFKNATNLSGRFTSHSVLPSEVFREYSALAVATMIESSRKHNENASQLINYRCAQCMLLSQLFHKGMYIDACVLNKKLIDIYIMLTCTCIFLHVHLIMKIRNMVKKYALFQLKLSKI